MKISINFEIDKSNEAEVCYGKSIELTYMSLKMMQGLSNENIPDVSCEVIDSEDKINYRIETTQTLEEGDLQKMWGDILSKYKEGI